MKRSLYLLFAGIGLIIQLSAKAQDVPINKFDRRAFVVIDSFMTAIVNHPGDEQAAAIAALPYIHRSEYNNSGTNLKQDRLDFSFKKAWQNAKFYKLSVEVTRIQKQNITAIGFGNTAETGTAYKIWIAKKNGVSGLPAPLNVFFPANGSDPKLYYYGSL